MKKIFCITFICFYSFVAYSTENITTEPRVFTEKAIYLFASIDEAHPIAGGTLAFDTLTTSHLEETSANIKLIEESIKLNYKSPYSYADIYAYYLGKLYIILQEFDKALEIYDKAIALDKNLCAAYFNKGALLGYLGKTKEGLEYIDKALSLKSDVAGMYLEKAIVLGLSSKKQEALENYKKAIKLLPESAEIYKELGIFYYRNKEYDKAIETFDIVSKLSKDNQSLLLESFELKIFIAKKVKDYQKILDNLQEMISLYPLLPETYFKYAEVLINDIRKPKDAIKFLNKNKSLMDKYSLFYQMNGLALSDLKKCKQTIKYYDKAIKMDANNPNLYINRAICRGDSKEDKELALLDLNKTEILAPENPLVYFNRGNIYQDLGNYEQAMADAKKALSLDSSLINAYLNMAEYSIFENQLEDALFYILEYQTKTQNPSISKKDYKKWNKELKKYKDNPIAEKIQKVISIFNLINDYSPYG